MELYILEGSLDAKKYLQKESSKISETIAKRGDDDALSKFISLGLMDEETLKKNDADCDGKETADFNSISTG